MKNTTELIHLCIKGDRTAQKAFYDLYSPVMYKVCLNIVKCREDAEDCLQMGFIKAFHNLASFRFEGSFEGWLRILFTNLCRSELRKRITYSEIFDIYIDHAPTGYHNLLRKEMEAERLKLAKGLRDAVVLYSIGYSHREIGELLGYKPNTSKSQYCRGKQMLKKRLNLI